MLIMSKTVCVEVKNPEWARKSEANILSWQHLTAIQQQNATEREITLNRRKCKTARGHSTPASGDNRGVNNGGSSRYLKLTDGYAPV